MATTLPLMAFQQANQPAPKQEIWVTVNGEDCHFATAQPFVSDGYTLTPLRGVFEKIGAKVDYDDTTQKISAYKDDLEVILKVGSNYAMVNGKQEYVPMAPRIVSGSTVVPLRFLSESLGGTVSWDSKAHTVNIYVPHREGDLKAPISDPPRSTTGGGGL